ncbi:hypothetical protein OIV83_001022 [Microbotryomycetes sp. JL201]|nr:hypothetical protein OIV83_001022 [Microbotryomycetes sp. JL201]
MAPEQQQVATREGSRNLLAIMLAVTPVYLYSSQARSKLGLDTVHLGLIQIVLLLIFGQLSQWSPNNAVKTAADRVEQVVNNHSGRIENGSATTSSTTKSKPKKRRARRKQKKADPATTENKLFPASLCDRVVRNFLAATEPEYVKLLPPPSPQDEASSKDAPESMPLSDWKELFKEDNLVVKQHPTANKLFALQARFPNVPIRKLFEVLTTIDKRKEYDGMTQDAKEIERFEIVADAVEGNGAKREIKGAAVWLAMKGMGPIKSKDMVLLSVAGRMPTPVPIDSNTVSIEDQKESKMRMYCATSSFEHPDYPPQSGFNRMQMGVTGFLIEEDGEGGSNIVQVTDLSGLGSWVPGAVIRTVTQTMLPKTLYKLGKVAAALDLEKESRYPLEGDDWIPPLLGASDPKALEKSKSTALNNAETEEDDDVSDDEDDADDDESGSSTLADSDDDDSKHALSASSSRALHNLITQLKTVTSRLSSLEQQQQNPQAGKKWYSSLIPGTNQDLMMSTGGNRTLLLTMIGGGAGAAIAMAAMRAWERRRA